MLHRIGDEDLGAGNSRLRQRPVEDTSGRADERLAAEVLLVAGLLADEDDLGGPLPLPEDGLGRFLPEVAGLAVGRGIPPRPDTLGLRKVGIFKAGLGPDSGGFEGACPPCQRSRELTEQATDPNVPA